MPTPLNGEQTRPLSPAGWHALAASATKTGLPLKDVNPGVKNRLARGDGTPEAEPYAVVTTDSNGRRVLTATDAGRAMLATLDDTCTSCARRPGEVNHPRGAIFVGWGRGWEHCPVCKGTTRKLPELR